MLLETAPRHAATRRHRDAFSLTAGTFALAAIAFVAVIDLWWGLTHDNYSYIADTISDLAAGVNSWTMDLALQFYAAAIAVIGIALYRWGLGESAGAPLRYRVGCVLVMLLAPVVYVIATYDAYSGLKMSEMTVHRYMVYALGIGFPLAAWLTGPGFEAVSTRWRDLSYTLGVVWALAVPYFLVMSTSWDGIYERGLALILLIWFAVAAWKLTRHGLGRT